MSLFCVNIQSRVHDDRTIQSWRWVAMLDKSTVMSITISVVRSAVRTQKLRLQAKGDWGISKQWIGIYLCYLRLLIISDFRNIVVSSDFHRLYIGYAWLKAGWFVPSNAMKLKTVNAEIAFSRSATTEGIRQWNVVRSKTLLVIWNLLANRAGRQTN